MSTSSGPTTTQTSGISPQLAPFLSQLGGMATNYANTPYQQYQGMQVAPLSPLQNQATQNYGSLIGGTPGTQAADQMLQQTLSGQGGNPFTQQVIDAANRQATLAYGDATAGVTQRFNSPGSFGGARNQIAQDRANTDLATGLANADGGLLSNAYEGERNRQMQAVNGATSLYGTQLGAQGQGLAAGQVQQTYGQNLANAQQGNFNNYVNYPVSQLQNLAGLLTGMRGATPTSSTTQGPAPDPLMQGLGLTLLGSKMGSGSSKSA